jgi:hypothetical protein
VNKEPIVVKYLDSLQLKVDFESMWVNLIGDKVLFRQSGEIDSNSRTAMLLGQRKVFSEIFGHFNAFVQ